MVMLSDSDLEQGEEVARDERLVGRGDFLEGSRRWSAVVIGGVFFGSLAEPTARAGRVNRVGGWVNGGGSWVNSRGGWINR
jgi:hypothetical protein